MRTKLPTLLVAMLLAIAATCQPNGKFTDYWGKVTLADLQIKEYAFDKKADALMLYDLGNAYNEHEKSFVEGYRFTVTSAYYRRVFFLVSAPCWPLQNLPVVWIKCRRT